jgi:hypothetical protein
LTEEQGATVTRLERASVKHLQYAGFRLTRVDISEGNPPGADLIDLEECDLPCMVLFPPREHPTESPVWKGDLSAETAAVLLDCPARREVAQRLLDGHCAVWVLVESGDADMDAKAEEQLGTSLSRLEKTLQASVDDEERALADVGPPVAARLSHLCISRDDAAEGVFREMLLSCEPDLRDYAAYPMAFPMYGRGRALYALVGKGITDENIEEACLDWDAELRKRGGATESSQPLVSLASLAEAAEEPEPAPEAVVPVEGVAVETPSGDGTNTLARNMLFAFGLLLVVVVILSLRVLKPLSKGAS